MVGLHEEITISFLPVGHTKFSPDWCFGLLKKKFRRSVVNCLDDLVSVVETSAEVNVAQLVGTQSGEVIVPTYNWSEYFKKTTKRIPGIKKYHHFTFRSSNPGKVFVKETVTSEENVFTSIVVDYAPSTDALPLPPIVQPAGLNNDRQWYLYNSIRLFCSTDTRDLVCPLPTSNPPSHPHETVLPTTSGDREDCGNPSAQPPKRQRKCGICQNPGHNRATCPDAESKILK